MARSELSGLAATAAAARCASGMYALPQLQAASASAAASANHALDAHLDDRRGVHFGAYDGAGRMACFLSFVSLKSIAEEIQEEHQRQVLGE